jgi:diadenosine tetraphosphate (Ap4A) HIT family hydrolase
MATGECIFDIVDAAIGSAGITPDRMVATDYDYWWLVHQRDEFRTESGLYAPGMLIAKRHFEVVELADMYESKELLDIARDAAETLCEARGVVMLDGAFRMAFNQDDGNKLVQSIRHAHVHILPVSSYDHPAMQSASGIDSAYRALGAQRRTPTASS